MARLELEGCSCVVLIGMERPAALSDDELTAWLRAAMAASHNLPGRADLFMAGVCAERLVDLLRLAELVVVRLGENDVPASER